MNRRSFLRMIGMSPLAAVPAASNEQAVAKTYTIEARGADAAMVMRWGREMEAAMMRNGISKNRRTRA